MEVSFSSTPMRTTTGTEDTANTHIFNIASRLIETGWNLKGEGFTVIIENSVTMLERQGIKFKFQDFSRIQEVAQEVAQNILKQGQEPPPRSFDPTQISSNLQPYSTPPTTTGKKSSIANATSFINLDEDHEDIFKRLHEHLYSLSNMNPYLIRELCGKLENLQKEPIDISDEQELLYKIGQFLPYETKELFKKLISPLSKGEINSSSLDKVIIDFKKKLKKFTNELHEYNELKLKNYEKWVDLERLLTIPDFMALREGDLKKLHNSINGGSIAQLQKDTKSLNKLGALNFDNINKHLKSNGYTYNIQTLLSEVIERRPKRKDGICTKWYHPPESFIDNVLSLSDLQGATHYGTITKCERSPLGTLTFLLHDRSEIVVTKQYQVTLTKRYQYKLWTAIFNNFIHDGDAFDIEHIQDADISNCLQRGRYILSNSNNSRISARLYGNNYFQFDLLDISKQKKYRLKADLQSRNDKIYHLGIQIWDQNQNNFTKKKQIGIEAFDRIHLAVKKDEKHLIGINEANIDGSIQIRDEPNEEKIKLKRLAQAEKELIEIRTSLLHNPGLLEKLIDNFYENKLEKIDLSIVRDNDPKLANRITDLSRKYDKELKIEYSEEKIINQIILEANDIQLVDKKDNIATAKLMKLLKDACFHADKILDKEVILVMGNTGSGKSTTVTWLMGAPLEEFSNCAGEKVVKIAGKEDFFPKIGQSICTPETVLAQAFPLPNKMILMVDCPGFIETRGIIYEICTNFSIDKAVTQAKKIRSLIIVFPVNAFLNDKGNGVIELFNTLKARFPQILNIDDNSGFYLLFSKQNQAQTEVVESLRNGNTFLELVKGAQAQIDELQKSDPELESFELRSIQNRKRIWDVLFCMWQKGRIDIIDTVNEALRDRLLEKYTLENSNPSQNYKEAMLEDDLQKKLRDRIQMSTHTWTNLIFEAYLKAIPKNIKTSQQEIEKKNVMLEELKRESQQRCEKEKEFEVKKKNLQSLITQLENPVNWESELIQNKQKAAKHFSEKLEYEKSELEKIIETIKSKGVQLQNIEGDIKKLESDIATTQKEIDSLKNRVKQEETGHTISSLHSSTVFEPDKDISIMVWKDRTARMNAYLRGHEEPTDFDPKKTYGIKAKDYRGVTENIASIERKYRLVPSDPMQQQEFLETGKGGGFTAKVDGLRYTIDLTCRPLPGEKKVIYGYKLDFNGDGIPWIQISYQIPNSEYNYATITNLRADIELSEKKLISLDNQLNTEEITSLKNRKIEIQNAIKVLTQEKDASNLKIAQIEKDRTREQVKHLLAQYQQESEEFEKEIINLKKLQDCDNEKINGIKQEIAAEQENLKSLHKQLRNMAILIVDQWESAKLLRKLTAIVVETKNPTNTQKSEAIKSCEKYIKMFDEKKEQLLSDIKSNYDLEIKTKSNF